MQGLGKDGEKAWIGSGILLLLLGVSQGTAAATESIVSMEVRAELLRRDGLWFNSFAFP